MHLCLCKGKNYVICPVLKNLFLWNVMGCFLCIWNASRCWWSLIWGIDFFIANFSPGSTHTQKKECKGRCKPRCSRNEYEGFGMTCHNIEHAYCCKGTGNIPNFCYGTQLFWWDFGLRCSEGETFSLLWSRVGEREISFDKAFIFQTFPVAKEQHLS